MTMPVRKPWLKKTGKRIEKTTVWESWSKDRQPVPIDQIRREGIMLATRSFQNNPPPPLKKTGAVPGRQSIMDRLPRGHSLKTEAKSAARIGKKPCVETGVTQKKRVRDTDRLRQRSVKSHADASNHEGAARKKLA